VQRKSQPSVVLRFAQTFLPSSFPAFNLKLTIPQEVQHIMATPTIPGMENIMAAQRAALEASLEIAGKAIEGIERLTALNMQLVRETLDHQGEFAKATMGAKDPAALMNISKTMAAPASERAATYAKQAYSIASETSNAITGSVQHQVKAAQKTMTDALDTASRNAPVGSEQLFAAARSAMQVASQSVDQAVNASTKFAAAASQGVESLTKASAAAAKKATSA
jgi:phasin family protein